MVKCLLSKREKLNSDTQHPHKKLAVEMHRCNHSVDYTEIERCFGLVNPGLLTCMHRHVHLHTYNHAHMNTYTHITHTHTDNMNYSNGRGYDPSGKNRSVI